MNTSKKAAIIIFAGLFLGTMFSSVAQISHGGMPYSFKKSISLSQIDVELLPYHDNEALLEEEVFPSKNEGFIFGKEIEVNYNLENSGLWETLPNGGRLWRLAIQSTGAYSLNLVFDGFYLPSHSNLFIYTEDRSYIMGSFTEKNNNQWGNFATSLLPGDAITLEYYEAPQDYGKGIVQLSTIVHGYKNLLFHKGKHGAAQGKCHIDVNCSIGDSYPNAKRAVALILNKKYALCSGTLLNNTAQDGKPYFLTAFHCVDANNNGILEQSEKDNLKNWVFVFDYESIECGSKTERESKSISGAALVASYNHSDFALLLLNDKPTEEFKAYYAGWDRRNISVAGTVCIHHPLGDIKKISKNNKILESSKYSDDDPNFPDNTHWEVTNWNFGSTEGGSSGSALFNDREQVIGQLEGGSALCNGNSPNSGADYYGKFYYSWTSGNNPNMDCSLNQWLDPIGTNAEFLKGYDPYETVSLTVFIQEAANITISPNPATYIVKIEANTQISSCKIYAINGQHIKSTEGDSDVVTINVGDLSSGVYFIKIECDNKIITKKLVKK